MSTTPLPIDQFAAKVRSSYPGAYDHLSDPELVQKVVTKYPEYKDKIASYAPTQFEKDRPGKGITTEGAGGAIADQVKSMMPDIKTDSPFHFLFGDGPKFDWQNSGINRAVQETKAGWQRGKESGNPLAPVGQAITSGLASLGGVSAQKEEQNAERGEGGKILGDVALPLASAIAPVAFKGATAVASHPMVRAAIDSSGIARVPEKLGLTVPDAPKAFRQAIQPGVNIPRAGESIDIAGPRLQQVKQGMTRPDGTPFEYKTHADILEGVKAAKSQVYDAIEQRLGPVADLQPDTKPIADAMRDSISKRTRNQFPAQAEAIEKRAATYDNGGHTLRDIEGYIQDANDDLKGYYKQPAAGDSSVSAGMRGTLAEVKALRGLLDDKMESLSGSGVADLKREYGALRDVERAAARQNAVATRQKGATLWEGLAALHAAGDFATGNLLGAAKGAGTLAVGQWLKKLRDPNFLINESFQGKKAFDTAPDIPPPNPPNIKGLLPKPPTEAGWGGGEAADTSGSFRDPSARWTTPKALLSAPKEEAAPPPPAPKLAKAASEAIKPKPPAAPLATDEGIGALVRDPSKAEQTRPVREAYKPEEVEDAKLFIRSILDTMASGDRPGRYFNEWDPENRPIKQNLSIKEGERAGGHWMSVTSMRDQLPWIKDHPEWSPSQLERALKSGDGSPLYEKAVRSAIEHLQREKMTPEEKATSMQDKMGRLMRFLKGSKGE